MLQNELTEFGCKIKFGSKKMKENIESNARYCYSKKNKLRILFNICRFTLVLMDRL